MNKVNKFKNNRIFNILYFIINFNLNSKLFMEIYGNKNNGKAHILCIYHLQL